MFFNKVKGKLVDPVTVAAEAPVVMAEPIEKETRANVPNEATGALKSIPAVLRAVLIQRNLSDEISDALASDTADREKGCHVQVISDSQIPVESVGNNAEIIIDHLAIDKRINDEAFWHSFVARIIVRGTIEFTDVANLIEMQPKLGKGYTLVKGQDGIVGIVHVTKAGLNALFPQGDGMYRVVSNNKRFNGEAFVGVAAAKGFLGGRY